MKWHLSTTLKIKTLFLLAAVLSNSVLIKTNCTFGQNVLPHTANYNQHNRTEARQHNVPFIKAQEYYSTNTVTSLTLSVQETENILNGQRLRHRSYNGGLVGPVIRVRPGSDLKVRLENHLPAEPAIPHLPNKPHGFNTTNLHTHGLHVSPLNPADNVLKEIPPAGHYNYTFALPADHPSGTFWYHAHKHGSTALQLASGMAGALIVEGGLDDIPEIRAAEEKIMVLQQFSYQKISGSPAIVNPDLLFSGEAERVTAINGVVTPTIVMRPGEVQRWRIIHAGTEEALPLDAENIGFYEIAVDGMATGCLDHKYLVDLYPGNRTDILIKAPLEAGVHMFYSEITDPKKAITKKVVPRNYLLRLVISGAPLDMPLPSKASVAAVAFRPAGIASTKNPVMRTLSFSDQNGQFTIDGKLFDPADIPQKPILGSVEEWELSSAGGVHPFHIHVNPFQMKTNDPARPWVWRDTVPLVAFEDPTTIRIKFENFSGKTVLHCHNLLHEDQGMMQAIEIVPSHKTVQQKPDDNSTHGNANPQSADSAAKLAPAWKAATRQGHVISSTSYRNKLTLVVLHRGLECLHCAEQLNELRAHHKQLVEAGIELVAISPFLPQDPETAETLDQFPFPVLVDKDRQSFRDFACLSTKGDVQHGLFLIDRQNRLLLGHRTDTAVADPVKYVLDILQPSREQP